MSTRGGDETRSNPWLAELQQQMFVEVHPRDANNLGVRDGDMVWVEGPEGGKVKVQQWSPSVLASVLHLCHSISVGCSKAKTFVPSTQMELIHTCLGNLLTQFVHTATIR